MVEFIFLIGLSAPILPPSHNAQSHLLQNTKQNALYISSEHLEK